MTQPYTIGDFRVHLIASVKREAALPLGRNSLLRTGMVSDPSSVRKLSISFVGTSNNGFFDREAHYRGTHGTMELGTNWLRLYAERKGSPLFEQYVPLGEADQYQDLRAEPIHREATDYGDSTLNHLDNFFVNVKSRGECNAPVRDSFKATVAMAMAIQSYKAERTARWDATRERIVI